MSLSAGGTGGTGDASGAARQPAAVGAGEVEVEVAVGVEVEAVIVVVVVVVAVAVAVVATVEQSEEHWTTTIDGEVSVTGGRHRACCGGIEGLCYSSLCVLMCYCAVCFWLKEIINPDGISMWWTRNTGQGKREKYELKNSDRSEALWYKIYEET